MVIKHVSPILPEPVPSPGVFVKWAIFEEQAGLIPSMAQWQGNAEKGMQDMATRARASTLLGSSMVEHAAVNRRVVGSSPTRGAISSLLTL